MHSKRKSGQQEEQKSKLLFPKATAAKQIEDQIQQGISIKDKHVDDEAGFRLLENDFLTWDEYNRTMLARLFFCSEVLQEYSSMGIGIISMGVRYPHEEYDEFKRDITEKLRLLQSIKGRLNLFCQDEEPEGDSSSTSSQRRSGNRQMSKRVFIVHGHDDETKLKVERFVKQLDLEPVILSEKASKGMTIIEKFEEYSNVGFAIVLLTGDDVGCARIQYDDNPESLNLRVRQNVILELGFFLASLGRSKTAALYENGVELPTDVSGIIWIPLYEEWRLKLGIEMRSAGLPVDMNKIS